MATYMVCDLCLKSRPTDIKLISLKCAKIWEHDGNRLVNAAWNPINGRLEAVHLHQAVALPSSPSSAIRPMPRVFFSGEFRLCDRGTRCRGNRCTHAHSVEEQQAWNAQKFGSLVSAPLQSPKQIAPPSTAMIPEWPSLPSQQRNAAPVPAKPSAWVHPLQMPRPIASPQHVAQVPQRQPRHSTAPGSTFTPLPHPSRKRYSSYPSADRSANQQVLPGFGQQYGVPSAIISPPANASMVGDRFHLPMQQPTQQLQQNPPSPMGWPDPHAPPVFHQPAFGRHFDPYADNPRADNPHSLHAAPVPYLPSGRPLRVEKQQSFPSFPSMGPLSQRDVLHQPLTHSNYKEKFLALLNAEEISHSEILTQKCSGSYTLQLHQAGLKRPAWMRRDAKPEHKRFGYFLGLDGDQIAYAAQASESLAILHNGKPLCNAEILPENVSHTEERLYIALDQMNVGKLEVSSLQLKRDMFRCNGLRVEFELKHSYFYRLKESVKKLPIDIIQKIIPEASSFASHPIPIDRECLERCRKSCSPDQFTALVTIARCPADGPPILIAGAFGTGKTRLLAVAANYFFHECNKRNMPARVLVCTQQWVSAESFLKCYVHDLMFDTSDDEICIIRSSGYRTEKSQLSHFYKTTKDFSIRLDRSSYRNQSNYLVITTCQTALSFSRACPAGFFTHILLDEGAQTREPEAIAPLSMATPNTKIIIAGDKNQVGPSMLVLGEKAHENGLATSLQERLERRYRKLGGTAVHYRATLATNYRCHADILEVGSLFYDMPLQSAPKHSPSAHPDAPYPLVFICSSTDRYTQMISDNLNEAEAEIILGEVVKFAKRWPNASWGEKDLSRFCVMSPSRGQLTVINQLIWTKRFPSKLKAISRYPTYDIQGREFRALFLSTSEPTEQDSSTKNPTKSLCDRFVFNTALTRAQSLVVSVGNPFMLLKMERHMVSRYGDKGKCWSHYLKRCLDHGTIMVANAPQKQQELVLQQLRQLVYEQLGIVSPIAPHTEVAMKDQTRAQMRAQTKAQAEPQPTTARSKARPKTQVAARVQQPPSSPHQPRTDSGNAIPIQESAPLKSQRLVPELKVQESHADVSEATVTDRSSNFQFEHRLGKGGFGVVFQVRHKHVDKLYAIKVIPLDRQIKDKVMREVKALARLDHPRVVRYYDFWEESAPEGWTQSNEKPWSSIQSLVGNADQSPQLARHEVRGSSPHMTPSTAHTQSSSNEVLLGAAMMAVETSDSVVTFRDENPNSGKEMDSVHHQAMSAASVSLYLPPPLPPPRCLFIQTELCREHTLRTWLQNNRDERRKKTVLSFFEQILEALCHIHSKNVNLVHRDLKPSNIFFSCGEEDKLKVGDFGLAKVCAGADPGTLMSDGSQQRSASSVAGTLPYMSPEQRAGKPCDAKSDVYSLGVIFFEMLCPCKTEMEKVEVLKDLHQMKFPPVFRERLPLEIEFIQLLLARKQRRPSAAEIQESDLLRRIKKKTKKAKHHFVLVL